MKLVRWLSLGAVLLSSSVSLGDQQTPIAAARFGISIDGYQISAAAFEGGGDVSTAPKASTTPLQIVVDRTTGAPKWAWIATSINQGAVEKKLVGTPRGKRRATFDGSTITELKLDDLDASSNTQTMKVTVTVVPKQIAPAKATAETKPAPAQKGWSPSNFKLSIDGVQLHKVSKIDSFTIKQRVVNDDSAKAMVLDSARITLGAADAKKLSSAIAKGTSKKLSIALTNDDGSTWKTLTVSGLTVQSTKTSGASGSITIKGSKILMN